jgi:voltage-gated sodium channel
LSARERVQRLTESNAFQRTIIAVILLNALLLGLLTVDGLNSPALHLLDRALLGVFVIELGLRIYAHGWRFFRDPWSIFDLLIVCIALVPVTGGLSILRSLRIIRALRLITAVPSLRRVVRGLMGAIPGMLSIVMLLCLVLYIGAVLATELYGATVPEYFGNIGRSLFTLFQVMTGEAWPEIAREVLPHHPSAWIFFVLYILVSTFVVLNLLTAVVVTAMDADHDDEGATDEATRLTEGRALRAEMAQFRAMYLEREGAEVGEPD